MKCPFVSAISILPTRKIQIHIVLVEYAYSKFCWWSIYFHVDNMLLSKVFLRKPNHLWNSLIWQRDSLGKERQNKEMTDKFNFMAEQNFSIDLKAVFFFNLGFASLTPLPLAFFACLCECGWCEQLLMATALLPLHWERRSCSSTQLACRPVSLAVLLLCHDWMLVSVAEFPLTHLPIQLCLWRSQLAWSCSVLCSEEKHGDKRWCRKSFSKEHCWYIQSFTTDFLSTSRCGTWVSEWGKQLWCISLPNFKWTCNWWMEADSAHPPTCREVPARSQQLSLRNKQNLSTKGRHQPNFLNAHSNQQSVPEVVVAATSPSGSELSPGSGWCWSHPKQVWSPVLRLRPILQLKIYLERC